MRLAAFAARRIVAMLFTMLGVITFMFFLIRAVPGDAADAVIGPDLDPSVGDTLREAYGLDGSIWVQYLKFVQNVFTLDFGISFDSQAQVADVLGDKMVNTLLLAVPALILGKGIGIALGILAASNRGKLVDRVLTRSMLLMQSAPPFLMATVFLMLFAYWLGWLPSGGMSDPAADPKGLLASTLSIDFAKHLALPLLVSTVISMIWPMLTMRTAMIELLDQDFVHLLEATGMSRRRIMIRHAARNGLLPVVSLLPSMAGFLVGGQVLVETVFSWPGMGRALVSAVDAYDYPVLQGAFLLSAVAVIATGAVADILYAYLDPRVRVA